MTTNNTTTNTSESLALNLAVTTILDSYNKGMGKTCDPERNWKLSDEINVIDFEPSSGACELRFHLLPESLKIQSYAHALALLIVELNKGKPSADYLQHVSKGRLSLKHGDASKPSIIEEFKSLSLLSEDCLKSIAGISKSVKSTSSRFYDFTISSEFITTVYSNLVVLGYTNITKLSSGLDDIGLRAEMPVNDFKTLVG